MPKYLVAGRTIAITGGTGGLATALARALRDRGANIALLDLDEAAARSAAASLGPETVACGWAADVTDLPAMETALDRVVEHFGRLDVIIANAGVGGTVQLMAELEPTVWHTMLDVNLTGVFNTFRSAYPHIEKTGGYMLATSSLGAFVHNPLQGPYNATKAAVWALCNSWRQEVKHRGVAVGSLHPTFFKTPMTDETAADPAGGRLWNNYSGLFAMISIDVVVARAISGIERRAAHVVAPRSRAISAFAPGLLQSIVTRFGYPGTTIQESIDLIHQRVARRN